MKLLFAAVLALLATPALADPCEGPLPSTGQVFSGAVRYVGDGDSLCVGRTGDPGGWVEVRLADFDAPELNEPGGAAARTRLARLALGREVVCQAVPGRNGRSRSYDRVIAVCAVRGRSLGRTLRDEGAAEGGR